MQKSRFHILSLLVAATAVFVTLLVMPTVALAEPITTHDAEEILSALESDGDVQIVLDGDVSKEYSSLPSGQSVWCNLGSGNKTIDLAGYDLNISVNNHGFHYDWMTLLDGSSTAPIHVANTLYMFNIPSGSALTVDDTSGKNEGSIKYDGYMHAAGNGAAGTHSGGYYNTSVLYRNVFLVDGGNLIFNGGSIETRSKEQYVSPGRVIDSLLGGRIDDDVRQQVNCVGITMLDGSTTVNGGVIQGRGYRYMLTSPIEYGAWGLNNYTRAAAILAHGGNLVINDGEFEGKGGSNVLEVSEASSVAVRAGSFTTHKVEYVLVPCYVDGEGSGTGAPRYMNGSYGTVGLDASYLDAEVVDAFVNGTKITTASWDADNLNNTHDVEITPKPNAPLKLIDGRNSTEIEGRNVVWDGVSSCTISVPIDMTFDGYPWLKAYWVGVAESTKSNPDGTSASIYINGQQYSAPDQATIEKTVGYNSSYPEVQTIIENNGNGWLSFDLLDLKPDGIGEGESFIVDFIIAQNLQPYNNGGYTHYLNRTRSIVVTIQPTDPVVTVQPEGVFEEDTSVTTTTLSAQATDATEAWWECEWPTYEVLEGSFDTTTGVATLEVPLTNSGHYYTCHFRNKYGAVSTERVCVRYAFDADIKDLETEVTMYTNSPYGDLVITGDLYFAFMRVAPEDRSVHWYKLVDGEWIGYNYQSGNSVIASTPHYRIGTPSLDDCGIYHAVINLKINGESYSFTSGNYNVTVLEGSAENAITRIDLYGIGHPHLGDIAPGMDDVTTGDERYSVGSLRWNAYPADREVTLAVPESYYEVEFKAADGYYFEYSTPHESKLGIPVYVDGVQVGWADPYGAGQDTTARFSYAYYPVTLTPSTGLGDSVIEVGAGGEIDGDIKSLNHFTDFGIVEEDAISIASAFSSTNLPEGVLLDANGHLSGSIAASAAGSTLRSTVNFKSSSTGDSQIPYGITFVVTDIIEPSLTLPEDANARNHTHSWGTWTDNGDGTHVRTCETCNAKESHEHTWDEGETIVAATAGSNGTIRYTCTECGATKEVSDPYETHDQLVKVDEVPATCTSDGVKEHYVCEQCGLMFWDAEGTEPILDDATEAVIDIEEPDVSDAAAYEAWLVRYNQMVAESTQTGMTAEEKLVIPATDHSWGEWVTITAPTVDTPGIQRRVCTNDESHFEERQAFIITYDLAGGTLDGKTGIVELVVGAGDTITLPLPTRDGYSFLYWQGSTYYAGQQYVVEGNHTFTAQWGQAALPGTGDSTGLVIGVLVCLAVISLIAIIVVLKKRNSNHGRHAR